SNHDTVMTPSPGQPDRATSTCGTNHPRGGWPGLLFPPTLQQEPRPMTSQGALMFALFASSQRAREAQAELSNGAELELIVTPAEVRRRASSTGMLARGLGMLLGVSLIAGFVIVGLG